MSLQSQGAAWVYLSSIIQCLCVFSPKLAQSKVLFNIFTCPPPLRAMYACTNFALLSLLPRQNLTTRMLIQLGSLAMLTVRIVIFSSSPHLMLRARVLLFVLTSFTLCSLEIMIYSAQVTLVMQASDWTDDPTSPCLEINCIMCWKLDIYV